MTLAIVLILDILGTYSKVHGIFIVFGIITIPKFPALSVFQHYSNLIYSTFSAFQVEY